MLGKQELFYFVVSDLQIYNYKLHLKITTYIYIYKVRIIFYILHYIYIKHMCLDLHTRTMKNLLSWKSL